MQPNQPAPEALVSPPPPVGVLRRALLVVALVVVLFLLGAAGIVLSEFRGLSPVVDGQPIGNLGYIVKDGYSSADVLDAGAERIVLVDTGSDPDGVALLASLAAHGQRPDQVVAILLTHGHADHTAGAHLFPQAKIYGMEAESRYLDGEFAYSGPLPRLFGAEDNGVRLSQALHDGDEVTIGELTVQAFAVPGHTAGSAAWLVGRILFLGDSGSATKLGRLVPAPWIFSDDVEENVASLHTLAASLQAQDAVLDRVVMSHTGILPGTALREFAFVSK